jgi:S-(hydroxymethyl)glutathione dehydrogenase / alcohol dehydrogenase
MRAAVLTEIDKPLEIFDFDQEPPKSKEVGVRVKAAGVCMSDWHIMNGDRPLPLPMVLGHEAAGVVVENGPDVDNVRPNDYVIFSCRPHCGRCRYCSSGQTVLCIGHNDTPRWRMHDGTARVKLNGEPVNQMARIGTFSEEVVCPAAEVVKVRDDLPFTHAAAIIGCSVATGTARWSVMPASRPAPACWWSGAAASGSTSSRAPGSPGQLQTSPAICATKSSATRGILARRTR